MTSRRKLKKNVRGVFDCLITEFLYLAARNSVQTDTDTLRALIEKIMKANNEYISRISHTEPGNVKGFYKKFHSDIKVSVDEISDELQKMV